MALINKVQYLKNYLIPKKTRTSFFICYHKEYMFKIIKQNSVTFLSWSYWKSIKDIFFLIYYPGKIWARTFTMSFDIYMKWKLHYSIFVWYIQFFLNSLEIQANQVNIHLTLTIQKFVLALNGKEIFKFKVSNKNLNFPSQFCLGSISNVCRATESTEVSLDGNMYDFSVDYNSIDKSEILNINRYLMTKNNIKQCSTFLNKYLLYYWI